MSLLQETVNSYVVSRIEQAFAKLEAVYENIYFTYHRMLKEGVADELPNDIEGAITELTKRYDAARRAISIINSDKFPKNSESFVLHRRRIWQNLNKINSLNKMLLKQMAGQLKQTDQGESNSAEVTPSSGQMNRPAQTQPAMNNMAA